MLLFPVFEPGYWPAINPRGEAVHAVFSHVFVAQLLELFGADARVCKRAVGIAIAAVYSHRLLCPRVEGLCSVACRRRYNSGACGCWFILP